MPPKLSDEEYAKRILARADKYLEQVDEAFILKQRGHSARAMPTFRPEEISLGPVLGTGGFGVVNEIIKFSLDPDEPGTPSINPDVVSEDGSENEAPIAELVMNGSPVEAEMTPNNSFDDGAANGSAHNDANDANGEANNEDTNGLIATSASEENEKETPTSEKRVKAITMAPSVSVKEEGGGQATTIQEGDGETHDHHYDVTQARHVMEKRVLRSGKARYALKRLHTDLTALERARGMIDLAVEAKYLSIVWHPNIIKMRGMAKGPMVDQDFFIILDRLVDTLDKRMNNMYLLHKKFSRTICGCGKNQKGLSDLILESMTIAYDLAAAFFYLHENRLVYRDIKPENIGFDMRGDVKVFDFGLCKNLSPQLKAKSGYGYRLTGRAGSLPYMAPEVAKMQTYDTKCDVFSFAILLWEMLACKPAFDDYSSLQYMDKVVAEEERLPIEKSWPPLTRLMIPEAWDSDPRKRPDMKRIAILIRGDLNDLTTDERILHRTRHLAERSQHSFNEELVPLHAKKNS